MRVQVAPGVQLDVVAEGDGPGVLLVHGLGGAKEDFAEVAERLVAAGFRVVAPDLRGHGGSDHPVGERAYSVDRLVEDLVALAAEVLPARYHLVGHSVGGIVAQGVALRSTGPLRSLALVDTTRGAFPGLDGGRAEAAAWLAREQGMDELRRRMEEQAQGSTPAHERLVRERPGYVAYNEAKWEALSAEMFASLVVEIAHRPDALGELAGLRLPTLVVVGEQDAALHDDARAMARAVPGARLVVVDDAGHAPQLEAPMAFSNELLTFFAEVDRTA